MKSSFATNTLRAVLGLCAASLMAGASAADDYPRSKPITIVLPYATGGSADNLARLAAEGIQKKLGQTVVVESRPGAGGVIGAEYVARAKPDGYTLLLTASGSMAVNPYTYDIKYEPLKDFSQVTVLVDLPFVVVGGPRLKADNLSELVALAKNKPQSLTFGNAGMGTQQHLTQLMFEKAAGIELTIVPYKGSMPALNDLLGGHLDIILDNTGVQTPFIQAGKVRPLFVTSQQRVSAIPDVPTAAEAGLPGFEAVAWFGLAAPAGTPPEIVASLQEAVAEHYRSPEISQRLAAQGMVAVASTPAEATARVERDLAAFGKIAKEIDLKRQ